MWILLLCLADGDDNDNDDNDDDDVVDVDFKKWKEQNLKENPERETGDSVDRRWRGRRVVVVEVRVGEEKEERSGAQVGDGRRKVNKQGEPKVIK